MLAWVSSEPRLGELTIREMATPEPRAGETLVAVEFAALNFSDLLMIEDKYQVRPPRPFSPGQEIAGTVVKVGPGSRIQLGQRVASKVLFGGFAEYALVRDDMAILLPDGLSLKSAAALPIVYTTAMVGLTECTTLKPGMTVLIHAAAGGVGLAAVQIAKAMNAYVIAAAGSDDKRALALRHGADTAIDYRIRGWADTVKTMTEGRGIDIVFDPVGGDVTLESLRCLSWGGCLLIVGFACGEIARIPANRLLLRRGSAIGVYWNHDRDAEMIGAVTSNLISMAQTGSIAPQIDDRYRFVELPAALDALATRRATGKLVVSTAGEPYGIAL
jgi:NADPH:quinone reductase